MGGGVAQTGVSRVGGSVLAVSAGSEYAFSKPAQAAIRLIAGLGVAGDVHASETVKHRSRLARTPDAPNLRQVHLLQSELIKELREKGFAVAPGRLGENITTAEIDLLALPSGARLRLGNEALVEVTGLRNPCRQIDEHIGSGAMAAVLDHADYGSLIRRAGIMAIVLQGGTVLPGDPITLEWVPQTAEPLMPV